VDSTSTVALLFFYTVALESLRRRVIGTVDIVCRPGPPPVLSKEEEGAIANYVI
jgi:hypothetical protein